MTSRSVESEVEVAVDRDTAFAVFTEEIDCWWVPGPINYYDSTRAHGKRIEPGVGGRVVEVYDKTTGDGLELARVTVWEPGRRLAWQSSRDDVAIEITFEEVAAGRTVVRVLARVPEGGADRGGTSWVRMTPVWLKSWTDKRDGVPREPMVLARLAVAVHYTKPAAAARWLRDVFLLQPAGKIPEGDGGESDWIEFHAGNASVMAFYRSQAVDTDTPVTHTPWIFVDDLDAHYDHVKRNGARIVNEIWHHGARAYSVADVEGHRWTFAQAGPRNT